MPVPTKSRRPTNRNPVDLPGAIPSEPVSMADAPVFGSDSTIRESLNDAMPEMGKSKPDTVLILEALKQSYALVGTITVAFSPADGFLIVQNAEEMAESWRMILDNDAKLRKRMKSLIQGSGWGTVITAHLPIAIAILNNHRDRFSHLIRSKKQSTPESN